MMPNMLAAELRIWSLSLQIKSFRRVYTRVLTAALTLLPACLTTPFKAVKTASRTPPSDACDLQFTTFQLFSCKVNGNPLMKINKHHLQTG